MKKEKFALPGERLSSVEEFLPGNGTFEEKGEIFAGVAGWLEYDSNLKVVQIKPKNEPCLLKEGQVVIGSITDLRDTLAIVEISAVSGSARAIGSETVATLRISKIAAGFVQDLAKLFRIGDIIRALVIQTKPTLQLSTQGREFGVLKAFCTSCRAPLGLELNKLVCKKCERIESRKIANDYGRGFA